MDILDRDSAAKRNVFHSRFALWEQVMAMGKPARVIAVTFTPISVEYRCTLADGGEVLVGSEFVEPLRIAV